MKARLAALCLLLISAQSNAQTTLKIATVTPEGSTWMKDMKSTAAEIKDKTDGRVVIKYYGGGSRGTDTVVLRKMRLRELQGGVFTPSAVMEVYPDIGLYGLPMVFRSQAEVDYVRERMDDQLLSGLEEAEENGAVVFHAGTSLKDGKIVNSGGRVLGAIRHAQRRGYFECCLNRRHDHSGHKTLWFQARIRRRCRGRGLYRRTDHAARHGRSGFLRRRSDWP